MRVSALIRPLLAAALVAALAGHAAEAHPHSWIDLKVAVLFDDTGKIKGLREDWLFDEVYTTYILDSFAKGKPLTPDRFAAIARKIMGNLKSYDNFTKAKANAKPLALGGIAAPGAAMQGRRFALTFTANFAEPVAPKGFAYEIYDPTYYIEMLHAEAKDAIRLVGAPAGCQPHVAKPTPSMDAIVRASSLDQTQTSDTGLGELFAEKITISCP
jgi:ABC-type uncharacterized transport system substrate-binding protein